jgi:hypothetical protein
MSYLKSAFVAGVVALLASPAFAGNCGWVVNGDFSDGNTGFTSAATYKSSGSLTAGEYTIHTSPFVVNGAYCGADHTSGSGNMMIVDSVVGAGWSQTVTLSPGNYSFSAWVTNVVCSQSLPGPTVELRVGGVTVAGPLALPQNNAAWTQLSGPFNVTTGGPIVFEVWSSVGTHNGADWGLDDVCIDGVVATEHASWGVVKSRYR